MRLTHVRLLAGDFPASFRFYRDVLGLEPRMGEESGPYAEFQAGETILALFGRGAMAQAVSGVTASSGNPSDQVVLCLAVDDVDSTLAEVERKGASVVADPQDRPDWNVRTAHLRDPEGNLIELNRQLR